MGYKEHKKHAHGFVNCAVITVSTSRTKENDVSGKTVIGFLEGNGHTVLYYDVIKDDISQISQSLEHILDKEEVQAIIINGGTGIEKLHPLLSSNVTSHSIYVTDNVTSCGLFTEMLVIAETAGVG